MRNNDDKALQRRNDGGDRARAVAVKDELHLSKAELRVKSSEARAALASTLDAIEYKFDIPKQLRINRRRLTRALHELGEENGLALIGVALGVASVVGTLVWLGGNAIVSSRNRQH